MESTHADPRITLRTQGCATHMPGDPCRGALAPLRRGRECQPDAGGPPFERDTRHGDSRVRSALRSPAIHDANAAIRVPAEVDGGYSEWQDMALPPQRQVTCIRPIGLSSTYCAKDTFDPTKQ